MNIRNITRRHLCKTAGFLCAAGLLGIGWAFTGKREAYLEGVLKLHVGHIPVDEQALSSCATYYLQRAKPTEHAKIDKLVKISRMIGVSGVAKLLDSWAPYDNFRRRLVTYFLLNSTYFHRADVEDVVVFRHATGCGNPFARFD